MARSPTPTANPVLLQPQAAPVDTFVAPARNGLLDLATSLAPIGGELQTLLAERAEKQSEEDAIRGEAAFYQDNAEGLAEGVRRGDIGAHHSPAFVRGFKKSMASVDGRQLRSKFSQAYAAWGGKNSDDPAAYEGFVADFLRQNVTSQDPDYLKHLLPMTREMANSGGAAHEQYTAERVYSEGLTAGAADILQDVDDTLGADGEPDTPALFATINAKRAEKIAQGVNPADFDKTILDALSTTILTKGEEGRPLLRFFDEKVPGEAYTWSETPYGRKLKAATEEQLEVAVRSQASAEYTRQERAEKLAREDVYRTTLDRLAVDPNATFTDEEIGAAAKVDPKFRLTLQEMRKSLAEGSTDMGLLNSVYSDIIKGGGVNAVARAAQAGVFGKPEDLRSAYDFAKGFEEQGDKIDKALGGRVGKRFLTAIRERTSSKDALMGGLDGMTDEGFEATRDFEQLISNFVITNPNATPLQVEEFMDRAWTSVSSGFVADPTQPGKDGSPMTAYERPSDVGSALGLPSGAGSERITRPEPEADADPSEGGAPLDDDTDPANPDTTEEWKPGDFPFGESYRKYREERDREADGAEKRTEVLPGETAVGLYQPASYSLEDDLPARPMGGDTTFLSTRAIQGATRLDSFTGMQPEFSGALEAILKGAPPEIADGLQVLSGYRSPERQAELWKDALGKYGSAAEARKWVAPPGKSGHNHGHAADLAFNGVRLDKAPKHVREWVHENAGKFGLAFPLGNEAWHVELAGARNGKTNGGRRGFSPEEAQSFLTAALVDNPLDTLDEPDDAQVAGDAGAGRLLNLIKQHEAAGNYNAVYGRADSKADLSKYTLDGILAAQERSTAASTAIGAYQFLEGTLRGLKKDLRLTGEEPFTKELQDRLAFALLQRRGYGAYKAGRISRRQFALRLSQEWSALPDPRTGRSYYAGDGLNASRVPVRTVYAALGMI